MKSKATHNIARYIEIEMIVGLEEAKIAVQEKFNLISFKKMCNWGGGDETLSKLDDEKKCIKINELECYKSGWCMK